MVIHIKGRVSESRVYLHTRSKKIRKESDQARLLTMTPLASPHVCWSVKELERIKAICPGPERTTQLGQQEKVGFDA